MSLRFQLAARESLKDICGLFRAVIMDMHIQGLKQWNWGEYPSESILEEDAARGMLYQIAQDDRIIGAFALVPEQEKQYSHLSWHFGVKPATLHRLVIAPEFFGRGLARHALVFAKEEALRLGYDSLRLDTSSENRRALKLFRSTMDRESGIIYFSRPNIAYHCFEASLSEQCPLLPVRMHPAFRHGDMTPWGGDGLRQLFGKVIPDERTGESMEISTIPGLESTDDMGVPLSTLIARYGKPFTGDVDELPLLLKLIATRDRLSVQVHPDNAYAKTREGKLGKSEAWVILRAEEGTGILYGMKPGAELPALHAALNAEADIEPLLEWVPVKAGDVFYIPSGMVHAIGGGIVLYELQQSSDVTYRLWDYRRANEKGDRRELHLEQAFEVINPGLPGQRTHLPHASQEGFHSLLDLPSFALDCACVDIELSLPPHPSGFRMFTALEGLHLCWDGGMLALQAGESALLPAFCPPLRIKGMGRALIARS